MSLELKGTIKVILDEQSGEGKNGAWRKQDFVIEYKDGDYPKLACFTSFGEKKIEYLNKYKVGQEVTVSFNAESKEWNGKYFTNLNAWKISGDTAQVSESGDDGLEPLPF